MVLNASAMDRSVGVTPAPASASTSRLAESLNLSVSQAGLENLTMSESKSDQLKAAFLLYCKRSLVSANCVPMQVTLEAFPQQLLVY